MIIWKNTCGESWQDTIENGWEVSGKPGAFLFFYPEGRTYSPPAKAGGGSPPIGRARALSEGDCGVCGRRWTRLHFCPNCQPCPCSRRRGFHFGSPCSWGGILPHPIRRLPASTCHRQLDTDTGVNKSFHPCWWYVAFHDVPVAIEYRRRAAAFHSSPSERTVGNGNLSFGGQDSQPWSWTLRRGCCGLSELFPDTQRVRRGAARLHP